MTLQRIFGYLTLSAISVVLLVLVITFQEFNDLPWVLPLATVTMSIAIYINNPSAVINSKKREKLNIVQLALLAVIVTFIVLIIYFNNEVGTFINTLIFRVSAGIFISLSWLYIALSTIKEYKMHNKSLKSRDRANRTAP